MAIPLLEEENPELGPGVEPDMVVSSAQVAVTVTGFVAGASAGAV
jgi:hypothetical protein